MVCPDSPHVSHLSPKQFPLKGVLGGERGPGRAARAPKRSQNWSYFGACARGASRTPFTLRTSFKGNLVPSANLGTHANINLFLPGATEGMSLILWNPENTHENVPRAPNLQIWPLSVQLHLWNFQKKSQNLTHFINFDSFHKFS